MAQEQVFIDSWSTLEHVRLAELLVKAKENFFMHWVGDRGGFKTGGPEDFIHTAAKSSPFQASTLYNAARRVLTDLHYKSHDEGSEVFGATIFIFLPVKVHSKQGPSKSVRSLFSIDMSLFDDYLSDKRNWSDMRAATWKFLDHFCEEHIGSNKCLRESTTECYSFIWRTQWLKERKPERQDAAKGEGKGRMKTDWERRRS